MKTILPFLLVPIMVLAQFHGQHQNDFSDIEFSMEFTMEPILNQEKNPLELVDGIFEIFVTVEIIVQEIDYIRPQFTHNDGVANLSPKYLNNFSVTGLSTIRGPRPQERLKRLLALNDPMFPKEDTILKGLHPVRYEQNKWGSVQNIPEGFGPRIRL